MRIVTTSPGFARSGAPRERLAALGWQLDRQLAPDGLAAALADAEYLVAGLPQVSAQTLAQAPRLKAVLKHGVGVDNIDIAACSARGVVVTNTPAANSDAVAELALGLMFAMVRNIPTGHASVISGGWNRQQGSQLGGKCLGIIGLGSIGKRLALLAKGIGMRVMAADPFPDHAFAAAHGIALADQAQVLAGADLVSLHVFGGAGTRSLIGRAEIAAMKPGARLLNLARGDVLDLDAAFAALSSGHLSGVAIDAFTTEPPDTAHPIFAHPKAVFSPHSGADTTEALEACGLMVIEDIATLISGGRPARCLNAKALK